MPSTVKTPITEPIRSSPFTLPASILLGLVSAVLLDFCFPIAGPMPPWRGFIAWVALIPLLVALLNQRAAAHPNYLRHAAITGYLCGLLWYILNCYWIYQTMLLYGNIPPFGSAGIVFLFSAVLGLYFGLFGFLLAFFRRHFGLVPAITLAPFLWVAIDLAAARITSVPWDQLGYSQVDSFLITRLAPLAGVYGITWFLVFINVQLVGVWMPGRRATMKIKAMVSGFALLAFLLNAFWMQPAPAPVETTAVLLQDNLSVDEDNSWIGNVFDPQTQHSIPLWDRNMATYSNASQQTCTPYYIGMPQPGSQYMAHPDCAASSISLIAWPEAPSAFRSGDPRFFFGMAGLAQSAHAAVVAGNIARQPVTVHGRMEIGVFNAASVWEANGRFGGVYDKIHLVPFGEYVPYREVFFFAHHLTQQVGDFNRGLKRLVFSTGDTGAGNHSFGVFICYESIFADEIRHFAKSGAEVLVNISDDGWYGDTSAPWQHLNMARMRAIENRRWLLRATNSGVTAAIDPYGRVTQSAPRHVFTSLAVRFGYVERRTFYTIFGDVFAWLCVLVVLGAIGKVYEPRWKEYQARRKAATEHPLV